MPVSPLPRPFPSPLPSPSPNGSGSSAQQDISDSIFNIELWVQRLKDLSNNIWTHPLEYIVYPAAKLAVIILLTLLMIRGTQKGIDHLFSMAPRKGNRTTTLCKLAHSTARYLVYSLAGVILLTTFGFNTATLMTGGGIIALGVALGSQNLVKDVINGFFLIFEGQIEVGDNVQINGKIQGTVEEVGLRVTKIREYNQKLHYMANGNIDIISNSSRTQMRAMVDVSIAPSADLDAVQIALEEAGENVMANYGDWLMGKPEVLGVTRADPNSIQITLAALVAPEKAWTLECRLREAAIKALQEHNIRWFIQANNNNTAQPKDPPVPSQASPSTPAIPGPSTPMSP